MKPKDGSLKVNKIDKLLTRRIGGNRGQILKSSIKLGNAERVPPKSSNSEMHRNTKKCYEQLYDN